MQVSTVTAAESRDQFLQLLVTQLRNQDPLEPVKQSEFLQQLAQFSTLEQMEHLNQSFEQQLSKQEDLSTLQSMTYATDLIGRTISYVGGEKEVKSGVVTSVEFKNGKTTVAIGDEAVTIDQFTRIE